MTPQQSLTDLSREQLHDLVWSTPVTKLAEQFGVSDVAIAKRCKKLFVPRPGRGYWVKLEFGKKVERPKLPAIPPSPADAFAAQAEKPIAPVTVLATDGPSFHPLAAQFLAALRSEKVSYDNHRVHLRQPELPEADVSKAQADRAAAAFHALLTILEPRGIPFRRALASYEGGHFRKGHDRLHFKIEEELIHKPEDAKPRKGYSSAGRYENKVPSGRLTFTINPERYGNSSEQKWAESEKTPLEVIVADMAKEMCRRFAASQKKRHAEAVQREKDRIESQIRWQKYQEEEAVRRQEETKRKHADSLEQTARSRQEDLIKAAGWWRHFRETEEFISGCESRWREAQNGAVAIEQDAWLSWARNVAKHLSPYEAGYPDPSCDGAFDAASIPFGGPYPTARRFPHPPSLPESPAQIVVQQSYGAMGTQPQSKPFPFWLMARAPELCAPDKLR